MKNRVFVWMAMLLAACVVLSTGNAAKAESESKEWYVAFTDQGVMDDSDLAAADLSYELSGLQPGDDMSLRINLTNNNAESTDWFMWNAVVESLEEQNYDANGNRVASAGAYTYILTFTGPDGVEHDIYRSEVVGGDENAIANREESAEGLHEATTTLKDYFSLFTLAPGQSGHVDLYVLLDGETQGNDYQDTLARLQMQFMVTLPEENSVPQKPEESSKPESSKPPTPPPTTNVKTGDDTNTMPYFFG